MTDPYSVLGVSPTATQAEITHAYRRHLRDHHPDIRSRESNSEADERLRQVLEAYALLRDPHRRAAYDRAHPAHQDTGPVPIPVTHNDSAADQPPLWAGPVRRHSYWPRLNESPPNRRPPTPVACGANSSRGHFKLTLPNQLAAVTSKGAGRSSRI